jgi:hypothetical protein
MELATRSLRTVRWTAAAPRVLALAFVAILAATGLRVIVAGPPAAPAAPTVHPTPPPDYAAQSFAQAFAREYLTWSAKAGPDERAARLKPYIGEGQDGNGGLEPADGTSQSVSWTAVAGTRKVDGGEQVLIAAGTSNGQLHLSVPVSRNDQGFLGVAGFPAVVGPPPVNTTDPARASGTERDVEDEGLLRVAQRAVTNFLAGEQENLLADLTPDAVVSLPELRLRVTDVRRTTWVTPQKTVAVEVEAQDARGDDWTLRYLLEVRLSDRWFVRSLHLDPTTGGE